MGLALVDDAGALLGLGEAATLPDWGTEAPEEAEASLMARALPPLPPAPDALDAWLEAIADDLNAMADKSDKGREALFRFVRG